MNLSNNSGKCYNSVSCVLSVLIIVFVLGSIIVDLCFTKPAMRQSIDEIKQEVRTINSKLDGNYTIVSDADTTAVTKVQ